MLNLFQKTKQLKYMALPMPHYFRLLVLLISCLSITQACSAKPLFERYALPMQTLDRYQQQGIELLAVFEIHNPKQRPWFYEFSGLAWDFDEQRLLSVTDNGYLVAFIPVFDGTDIVSMSIMKLAELLDKHQQPLGKSDRDSEGLALIHHQNGKMGDTELLVSFEGRPRIHRYTMDGRFLTKLALPVALSEGKLYQGNNQQLEALSILDEDTLSYVTASERPMKNDSPGQISLYSDTGLLSQIHLLNPEHGSIVGLTRYQQNDLIALERVFINRFSALGFHLHHLSAADHYQTIQQYSSYPNDALINDNFEGITHMAENYFFMITDDNQNALQRSLLVYFKLLP